MELLIQILGIIATVAAVGLLASPAWALLAAGLVLIVVGDLLDRKGEAK